MSTITIHKADPVVSDQPVEGIVIQIVKTLSEFDNLEEAKALYNKDAHFLFEAMRKNLPQGTKYRLTQLLLADSVNLYRGI